MAKWTGVSTALAVVVVLAAPGVGRAADDVPAATGAFVAYCDGHLKACQNYIVELQIGSALDPDARASGECLVPRGVQDAAAGKAIIGWLGGHPELNGRSTHDGVVAAIKAIWNCQDKVESGVTSLGSPDRTGAFVSFCADPAHRTVCDEEIVAASLSAYIAYQDGKPGQHCTSPDSVETPELASKVIAWLGRHPELNGQPTEDGIAMAIDAIWPCHGPARSK